MGAPHFRTILTQIGKAAAGAIVGVVLLCGPTQAQTAGAADPHAKAQQQPSPQGQTGPVNTGSGGTTPASPQGETPPDMQATSPGGAEAPKGK